MLPVNDRFAVILQHSITVLSSLWTLQIEKDLSRHRLRHIWPVSEPKIDVIQTHLLEYHVKTHFNVLRSSKVRPELGGYEDF